MRIACPHCGLRDLGEFTYQGDAGRKPPSLQADTDKWFEYVYNRSNPAGRHKEYWQHSGGCRCHMIVERNTVTHEIYAVRPVRPMAADPEKKKS